MRHLLIKKLVGQNGGEEKSNQNTRSDAGGGRAAQRVDPERESGASPNLPQKKEGSVLTQTTVLINEPAEGKAGVLSRKSAQKESPLSRRGRCRPWCVLLVEVRTRKTSWLRVCGVGVPVSPVISRGDRKILTVRWVCCGSKKTPAAHGAAPASFVASTRKVGESRQPGDRGCRSEVKNNQEKRAS